MSDNGKTWVGIKLVLILIFYICLFLLAIYL